MKYVFQLILNVLYYFCLMSYLYANEGAITQSKAGLVQTDLSPAHHINILRKTE